MLSVAAFPVTGYLTYLHYVPEEADFCNFNESFNCDVVNKSQWSVLDLGFFELPVAIAGFGSYVFFLVLSLMLIKKFDFRKVLGFLSDRVVLWLMFLFSVFGFLFSAWLTYIEAFVLFTFCIFCLMSQVLILLIMVLMGMALLRHKKSGA